MTNAVSILKQIISDRRSIREFLNKQVPKELLLEVIDAGRLAPSPTNSQPWYFLVVSGEDTKKISDIIRQEAEHIDVTGYKMICLDSAEIVEKAPHVITVWNMKYRSNRLKKLKDIIGEDYYKNFLLAEIASIGCAVENMWLTAQALGLGMVWLMPNIESYEKYSREFGINGDIIAYVPIGYPSSGAGVIYTQRKPLGKICAFYSPKDLVEL